MLLGKFSHLSAQEYTPLGTFQLLRSQSLHCNMTSGIWRVTWFPLGLFVICYQSLQQDIWYLLDPCYLEPYTWRLLLGTLHMVPYTWYSTTFTCTCYLVPYTLYHYLYPILCNPHLFPPLSSVMSAFVQTLPVPPVPGDLHPDTTCSNGKINGFSFTSVQFCKIYPLIHTSHDSHGEGGPCLVNCFAQKYLTEGLRNKVGTQALSRPAGWLSYISRA